MKLKLSQKIKTLIFLAVFLIGDILILTLIISRTVREISKLNQAIHNERMSLEARYQRRKTARLTVKNLNQIQAELPSLETTLVKAGSELDLITSLEEAAAKNNITQKINLFPREGKKDFGDKIFITLTVNGSFQDIMRYMDELERMKIIITLDNLTFSQGAKEDERLLGKIRGLLQGHLYYSK